MAREGESFQEKKKKEPGYIIVNKKKHEWLGVWNGTGSTKKHRRWTRDGCFVIGPTDSFHSIQSPISPPSALPPPPNTSFFDDSWSTLSPHVPPPP